MSLSPQPVAINFSGGVDTRTDAKQVIPGKLIDLVNGVFTKNSTISKRNGYSQLGPSVDGGGTITNPVGLAARGAELVQFATANAFSYRSGSDSWSTIGAVSSIVATADPVARTGTTQTAQDAAANGDITVCAWEDSRGGVWATAIETTGGRVLMVPVQLDAAGSRPRCIAVGTVLHVIWANGPALWIAVLNPASPSAFTAATILTNDLAANQSYDAIATFDAFSSSIQPGLIVWAAAGGFAAGYRLGYLHPSGVLGAPGNGLPSVTTVAGVVSTGIACAFDVASAADIAVGWVVGSNFAVNIHNSVTLAITSSSTPITFTAGQTRVAMEFGALDGGLGTLWYAVEDAGATSDLNLVTSGAIHTDGTVKQVNRVLRGHCIASRAWNDNGDVYCGVVHAVLFFPYVAVLQLSSSVLAAQARVLPGLTAGVPTRSILPSAYPVHPEQSNTGSTSRQHIVPLGYRIQLSGTSGTQFGEVGVYLYTFDFDHNDGYRTAQLGRGLYLASGMLQHYDGDRFAEADFHCAPDTATGTIATVKAAGGALTPSTTYVYKLCYEEIDAQGELHLGATSVGITVTLGVAETKVTITIPTYRLTSKRRVRIGVFRSLGNATGTIETIPFFRVSSVDPSAPPGNNTYVANDTTVDSISFVDVLSDAQAQTLEPLYTNGGILSNDPPSFAGTDIVGGKNRLFWPDPLDPNVVRYSQERRDETAVEMSDALSVRLDPLGGPIVAIAVMDDNVVVMKETAIFIFGGPGPSADGGLTTQNAWSPPQLVTSDVGCQSRSSVANVPNGVVFQSQKGIYLLGRDMQVQRIGDDVFAYNSQRISRATLLPDRPHVVFLTDAGRTLLYDYSRPPPPGSAGPGGQWSTFTNHEGYDAVVVDGIYYYLRTDGRVFKETVGLYVDGTQHIRRTVETAWLKMAGYLQGWQKILWASVIGTYYSSHKLQVSYRLDYEDQYTVLDPVDVDSTYTPYNYGAGNYGSGDYSGTPGPNTVYQEQFHLNKRCQSISFRIEDVENDVYGAAFDLSELLLTGGVLGPKFRPGAARSQ
jgi:hypothetical protein